MAINQSYSVYNPTVWSPFVNDRFKANLIAAKAFKDMSDDLSQGGDTIQIPHRKHTFSVGDISTTNGQVTAEQIDDTKTQLVLNNWKGSAFRFTDFQMKQIGNQYNLREGYASDLGYDIGQKLDDALLSEWSSLDTVIGDSATDLNSTQTEKALGIMESNSVPGDQLRFLLHPRMYYGDVFKRQKYYAANTFGEATLPEGSIARFYGTPIFKTNRIPAQNGSLKNLLVHPQAVTYALANQGGEGVKARLQEVPTEHLITKVVGDVMYGIKTLRSGAAVVIAATNNR